MKRHCQQPPRKISLKIVTSLSLLFFGLCRVQGEPPVWWSQRGVINDQPVSDFSPVNIGQLKYIASKACEELNASFPGGAGADLTALIQQWQTPSAATNDYAIVNLGQVKYVGKFFYDRLIAIGYTNQYPWSTGAASDYSPAVIGQVKQLFAFDAFTLNFALSSSGDGLPDWWKMYYFGTLNVAPQSDASGDGVTNSEAFSFALNPTVNAYGSGRQAPKPTPTTPPDVC
jgi:hypothetical protein